MARSRPPLGHGPGVDRLKSTTDAEGFVESYTWDDVGNQLSVTKRRGYTTDYGYDDLNQQVLVEDPPLAADAESLPAGEEPPRQTVERRFDALGNLLRETDRRGIVSIFQYDHENRLVQSERAGLVIETMQYDGNGNRIASTDANGHLTTFEFDERNLLTRVNAPLLAISRFELDESGDRVKESDPENKVIDREYDDRRRLEAEIVNGDRTEFGYDANGNLTLIDRPETPAWTRTYDGADRLKTVVDPNGGVTEYFYDGNGNLTSQVDAAQKETSFDYDDLNRMTLKTLADGAVATYDAYDENGNLTQRTDPNGTVFAMSYDELDRLVTLDLPEELDVGAVRKREFAYDRNNNLRGVTESRIGTDATALVPVTASRSYDDFDRLSTVTDRWGTTVLYGYDDNGNRTSVTGDGLSAIYTYDALNRMETVTSGLGVTEYEYYKNSRLMSVHYPNGAVAEYTWDLSNRLETIDNRVNLALVSGFEYGYDGNGNRTLQVEERTGDPPETTTYSYDLLDRLEEVVYPDQTTTYTYDSVGNRRTEVSISADPLVGTIVDRTYTYNDRHQVEMVENVAAGGATVTYGYDDNGNQISRLSSTDGRTDFTFDVFNRMTEVEKAGEVLGTYAYDERDLRIEKTSPEGTARYVYDDLSVLTRTLDGSKTKYYYGPDRLLGVDDPSEGTGFYLQDALRSVVDITRSDGSLMASYKYDAWGNYREEVDSGANPFGFTGHEHDDETGLIYAKARFYDPELGLFLSEDPAAGTLDNPPSLQRYLYVWANPTRYVDPDGRNPRMDQTAANSLQLQRDSPEIAITLVENVPAAGNLIEVVNATQGRDILRDEELSNLERTLTAGAFVPVPKFIRRGVTATVGAIAKSRPVQAAFDFVEEVSDDVLETFTRRAERRLDAGGGGPNSATTVVENADAPGTAQVSVDSTPSATTPASTRPSTEPVKPGDQGTYGDLKTQKRKYGETEPLDMDHRPSYAAQKKALEDKLGRELTPEEAKTLKKNTPAVATPRKDHQQDSRTYGGRNNKDQIEEDAKDLEKARRLDDEALGDGNEALGDGNEDG